MKSFVIDTNIIINNPSFLDEFEETEVILPIIVLEELDNLKSRPEVGYKARKFFNHLKMNGLTNIMDTDKTFGKGNRISTALSYDLNSIPECLDRNYGDNKILALDIFKEKECSLLTQDFSMVIKARAMGIDVQYYTKSNNKKLSEMYKGYVEIEVDDDVVDYFYSKGELDRNSLVDIVQNPNPNQFVLAKSKFNPKKSFIAIYKNVNGVEKWCKLKHSEKSVYGIKAKDAQQKMALELILDDDIQVVTLSGSQGTGKTIIALASALSETVDRDKYDSILLGKSTAPLDKWSYTGFLPGDLKDKLITQFGNFTSNLEYLHNMKSNSRRDKLTGQQALTEYMEQMRVIDLLDISSILGSSFQNKIIVIDEAQSFGFDAMRSILTRVGEGSKLILLGDVLQTTVEKIDIDRSGLFFAIQNLQDVSGVGHITLENIHRSKVVEQIAHKFDELV